MRYIVESAVKSKLKEHDRQIGPEGLTALDCKIEMYLEKIGKQFNGHRKKIDASLIGMLKL